eukprot:gene15226-16800_t
MANLRGAFVGQREDFCLLTVRRRKLWLDTCQKIKRLFADGVKPLTIRFIGEAAVDAGGPLKEYFTFVFEDAKKYLLCTGDGKTYGLIHDVEKVRKGDFRLFGTLLSLSLLQGCAGPRYMMPCVVSRLLNGPEIRPEVEEIPDLEIQTKLQDLLNAKDEAEFQMQMTSFTERFSLGVTRAFVGFDEREEFARMIAQHVCISACMEEFQEVRKGLDILGLLEILEDHYEESKEEFVFSCSQKAADLLSLFKETTYTDTTKRGINSESKRDAEEDIMYYLTEFLERISHEGPMHLTTIELNEDGEESEVVKKIGVEEVALFCTGSKYITPSMKGAGTICFDHEGKYGRIVANTCNIILTIPVTERYTESAEGFIKSITEDLRSDPGFGCV